MEVFHNPFARDPVPFELLPEAQHWFENDGEWQCSSVYEASVLWSQTLITNADKPAATLQNFRGTDHVHSEDHEIALSFLQNDDCLVSANARKGDTLAIVRLDRLGRSLSELLTTVAMLKEGGITLHSLEEKIDTSSAAGELVFHVFGAIAHFERRLISERTRDGVAAV